MTETSIIQHVDKLWTCYQQRQELSELYIVRAENARETSRATWPAAAAKANDKPRT